MFKHLKQYSANQIACMMTYAVVACFFFWAVATVILSLGVK